MPVPHLVAAWAYHGRTESAARLGVVACHVVKCGASRAVRVARCGAAPRRGAVRAVVVACRARLGVVLAGGHDTHMHAHAPIRVRPPACARETINQRYRTPYVCEISPGQPGPSAV